MTVGLVESRMRWKPHVRFGERAGETGRRERRHRAPVRLHQQVARSARSSSHRCQFRRRRVIVTVRLRRRRRVCARCGQTGPGLVIRDRRVKRWRHLDLGATRCVIECELRLLRCPDCRIVRAEPVPWARPGAHHTRDFDDVVAWLAQQMAKTPITKLMRIGWHTIGAIVERVVADHLDDSRLDGLVAIGCDEISYRRGQRYLTSVVDHQTGAIVWCSPGRNAQTLQAFFDELGPRRRQSIRAVSIDMSGSYAKAIRENVPRAEICFDPFHVVRLGQRAVDQVRHDEWNAHDRSRTKTGKWIKGTRWSLLKAPDKQSVRQLALLGEVAHANQAMFRAFFMWLSHKGCGRGRGGNRCAESDGFGGRRPSQSRNHALLDGAVPLHIVCATATHERATQDALPARGCGPRARAPRRLAGMGIEIAAAAVRQARTHDPPPPGRHPRRDPTWALQRPPGRPQQPHPPHQSPQLRLSLSPTAHRPRLPLLLAHRHRPAALTLTHNSTGAP